MKKINYNYLVICITLILIVTIMIVGYAKLTGVLNLSSSAVIKGDWNVCITSIELVDKTGDANVTSLSYSILSASFDVELKKPNDSVKYKVTVQNKGNIEAKLNSFNILPTPKSNDVILYSSENVILDEILKPNESKNFYIRVGYNSDKVEPIQSKSALILIEYVQSD